MEGRIVAPTKTNQGRLFIILGEAEEIVMHKAHGGDGDDKDGDKGNNDHPKEDGSYKDITEINDRG